MRSVEDLDVFKLAHQLTLKIYSVTKHMSEEVYAELRSGYDRVIQMLSRLSQRGEAATKSGNISRKGAKEIPLSSPFAKGGQREILPRHAWRENKLERDADKICAGCENFQP